MDKFLSAGPYSYSGKNVSGKIFHGSFAHLKSDGSYEYYDIAQRDHFQNPADVSVGFFSVKSSLQPTLKTKKNGTEWNIATVGGFLFSGRFQVPGKIGRG